MPRNPILSRDAFYDVLHDGSILMFDWNLVNTSLGQMVEARSITHAGNSCVQIDPTDMAPQTLKQFSRDQFYSAVNVGGDLALRTYNQN